MGLLNLFFGFSEDDWYNDPNYPGSNPQDDCLFTPKVKEKNNVPDYTKIVVLAPTGSNRRELPLHDVIIPDMWHLSAALENLGKLVAKLPEDQRSDLQELIGGVFNADPAALATAAAQVLEIWHLAHDLKRNLANDTEV